MLSPAQAAVMFTLAEDELVEPLHITNIVALNRGHIQLLPMCREKLEAPNAACDAGCALPDSDADGGTEPVHVPPPSA